MIKVKTDNATPGTRLARPVENESGMVLYGVGMEVTEQMLSKLQMMSVEIIYVEGQTEPRLGEQDYRKQLGTAFSRVRPEGPVLRLKRVMEEHLDGLYGKDEDGR